MTTPAACSTVPSSPADQSTSARPPAHQAGTLTAIAGQGAVGLLAASRLVLAGQPVSLLPRTEAQSPRQAVALPLTFSAAQQDHPLLLHRFDASAEANGQQSNAQQPNGQFQRLLVPVKAYDIELALQKWLPFCTVDADIVLCHNGMGTVERASALLLSTQKLWFASTTHGALKTGPYRLRHSGMGSTNLGPVNDAASHALSRQQSPFDWLQTALGPVQLVKDIQPLLWQKLAINAVINPLTALHQCKNGALAAPEFQAQIRQLIAEFCQVAAACDQQFVMPDLVGKVLQVIEATAENYSSMQQDRAAGRPDELEYITGFLLREAARHRLPMPAHLALYQALKADAP